MGPLIGHDNLYLSIIFMFTRVLSILHRFCVALPCDRTDFAPTMKPKITIKWSFYYLSATKGLISHLLMTSLYLSESGVHSRGELLYSKGGDWGDDHRY
jgi:hypothetical protein